MELAALRPSAVLLAAGVLLDLLLGDPQYRWHPIRLIGDSITWLEAGLRRMGLDGYAGGVALGLSSTAIWVALASALLLLAERIGYGLAFAVHAVIVYWMLALGNLLDHAWAVEAAARLQDVARARHATGQFVARDTQALDIAACRRASIESLSENLTDGYVSPLFWYVVAGIPGLIAFKVFSTLDSMVGNKSERYLRFGWFSARTDDVLNWIPARLTWLLIALVALVIPGCSARRALVVGLRQHSIVPGPNSGWSEAATAGAIRRRLVGPIVMGGRTVTDLWLGDPEAPPAGHDRRDLPIAMALTAATGVLTAIISIGALALRA
jgi:adenosylcobinamide-phosphate synthase